MVRREGLLAAVLVAGCSPDPGVLDIEILNPCNQEAIQEVDFLRIEPRGTDVDSAGLSTVQQVENTTAPPIRMPAAQDFHVVVTGHRGDFNSPPAAIGVSGSIDLSAGEQQVSLQVPIALVDRFYKTTDLADPATCSQLSVPRYGATATFIPENGRVLIVGGATLQGGALEFRRAIELYDPLTGRFDVVGELRSGGARAWHTATLLADGKVLIAGGEAVTAGATEALRSALIIDARDPGSVHVSDVIAMRKARTGHRAVRLADGRVVLIGGRVLSASATRPEEHTYLSSIELFWPDRRLFLVLSDPAGLNIIELPEPRFAHSATVLSSGRDLLVAGGFNDSGPVSTAIVLDFAGDRVAISDALPLSAPPILHSAVLLGDQSVLITGGYSETLDATNRGTPSAPTFEILEYSSPRIELTHRCSGALTRPRAEHTAAVLGRRVLLVGGVDDTGAASATGELFTPGEGAACATAPPTVIEMAEPRARHTAVTMGTGEILIVGGWDKQPGDQFGHSLSSAEVFSPARQP